MKELRLTRDVPPRCPSDVAHARRFDRVRKQEHLRDEPRWERRTAANQRPGGRCRRLVAPRPYTHRPVSLPASKRRLSWWSSKTHSQTGRRRGPGGDWP